MQRAIRWTAQKIGIPTKCPKTVEKMSEKCPKIGQEGPKHHFRTFFGQFIPILSMLFFGDPVQCSPVTKLAASQGAISKCFYFFSRATTWRQPVFLSAPSHRIRNRWRILSLTSIRKEFPQREQKFCYFIRATICNRWRIHLQRLIRNSLFEIWWQRGASEFTATAMRSAYLQLNLQRGATARALKETERQSHSLP